MVLEVLVVDALPPPLVPEGSVGIIAAVAGISIFLNQMWVSNWMNKRDFPNGPPSTLPQQVVVELYQDHPLFYPFAFGFITFNAVLQFELLATIFVLFGMAIALLATFYLVVTVVGNLGGA